MKKAVNPEELTKKLNVFIQDNSKKTFTSSELLEKLIEVGFNKNTAYSIMKKSFPFEKMGNSTLYGMPKEPVLKYVVIGVIDKDRERARDYQRSRKQQKSEEVSEEIAIKALSSKGYQIRRCIGFDIEGFAKENPDLYKKYLKYEII